MGCLDENKILAYVEHDLDEDGRAAVEHHTSQCASCRQLLSESIKLEHPAQAGDSLPGLVPLRKGDALGRYLILDTIGTGAMGLVYAAHDPKLDRKIAIKLLRRHTLLDPSGRERLEREARTLAQLSHPNVVNVYDVGDYGEAIFIAMEYVAGETLAAWSRPQKSWEQIRRIFLQAGRGLAAAHSAGIIHRDFKPDNILIGDDGRVRVTDFGLAGEVERNPQTHTTSASQDASLSLTRTGAVLGTPAYMAPAQLRGLPANEHSDQYSFCAALYEALCGQRPFAANTAAELAELAGQHTAPAFTPGSLVPQWLRRLVLRGLSADEEKRFPNMEALLVGLDRKRRMRTWAAVGAALLVVGLLGVVVATQGRSKQQPALACKGAEERLANTWDDELRIRLRAGFAATKVSYAGDSLTATEKALDSYTRAWTQMYRESCEATHIYKDQSEDVLDLRVACLEQKRHELSALVRVLIEPNEQLVQRAPQAASSLTSLQHCANVAALQSVLALPNDPIVREQVEHIREEIASIQMLKLTGKYEEGLSVADALVGEAETVGYEPALAELLLERCELQSFTGKDDLAEQSCVRAASLADAGKHDKVRARAAIYLVYIVGYKGSRHKEGHNWAQLGLAALNRYGHEDLLRGFYYSHLGALNMSEGDYQAALDHLQESLHFIESALGPTHPSSVIALESIGIVYSKLGNYVQALEHSQRATQLLVQSLGADHPDVGRARIPPPCFGHVGETRRRAKRPRSGAPQQPLGCLPSSRRHGSGKEAR